MQSHCISVDFSVTMFGLFYQEKDAEFLHSKKIITAYVVEVQQFFHGLYRMQHCCIFVECSKFLVYLNNLTGCRISASWLNPVNF